MELETSTGLIRDRRIVATNIIQGRLLSLGSNDFYVFYPTGQGLFCTHREGDNWAPVEAVLTWTVAAFKLGWPCFDVTTDANHEPLVVWSDETTDGGSFQTTLFESRHHDGWQAPQPIATVDGFVPNLQVARDSIGTVHLVYT